MTFCRAMSFVLVNIRNTNELGDEPEFNPEVAITYTL